VANKGSLDYILGSVLSIGAKERNLMYSPQIFANHFNVVTSFIIDKCIEAYPYHVDVLRPFMVTKIIGVTNGEVKLPDDYRNILGAPSISAKTDKSMECSDFPTNENQFNQDRLKAGCRRRPIEMLDENEFDDRTTSTYIYPTIWNPIGAVFKKDSIKVCPFDIGKVELRYVKKELQYIYNYTLQPDDTYIFNPVGSVESEWEDSASQLLVKGVLALYSAYLRDNQLSQYSQILNTAGLF
jgi:hypothetical protein